MRPASAALPLWRFALWCDKARRYGAASFAWLAEPKLTLRHKLA